MQPGDVITPDCVRSVRPGYGLAPKHFDRLIGKTVTQIIYKNTPVRISAFE